MVNSVALYYNVSVLFCCWMNHAGYEVQKQSVRAGDVQWTPVNTKLIPDTTFTVSDLVEHSKIEFRVVAVNNAGPSKPSNCTGPHTVRDPIRKSTHNGL